MLNYSALAPLYDRIMAHVEYDHWIAYIKRIIATYSDTAAPRMFEIGGGTGILGAKLLEAGFNYIGSDVSLAMCQSAQKKAVPFFAADALNLPIKQNHYFDVIFFLYDGINYLHSIPEYVKTFQEVFSLLKPNGLFLFDITTTANSLKNFNEFVDMGDFDDHFFFRRSYFSIVDSVQYNDFTIFSRDRSCDPSTKNSVRYFRKAMEHHSQKVFAVSAIKNAIPREKFSLLGTWDNFSFKRCTTRSERVHFLLRKKAVA